MADPFAVLQANQVNVPGLIQQYDGMKRQRLADLYQQRQMDRQDMQDTRASEQYMRESQARAAIADGAKPEDVIKIDPTTGFQYQSHAQSLAKEQRAAQGERAQAVGNAAMFVSRLPQQEQPAAWDQAIDQLVGQGYTDLAQYKGQYNPKALPGLIAASQEASKSYYGESDKDRSYAETVRAHHAEEESRRAGLGMQAAGVAISRGHLAIAQRADARAANAPSGVYPVQSKADYDGLASGTHYSAPDGTVRVKP